MPKKYIKSWHRRVIESHIYEAVREPKTGNVDIPALLQLQFRYMRIYQGANRPNRRAYALLFLRVLNDELFTRAELANYNEPTRVARWLLRWGPPASGDDRSE